MGLLTFSINVPWTAASRPPGWAMSFVRELDDFAAVGRETARDLLTGALILVSILNINGIAQAEGL